MSDGSRIAIVTGSSSGLGAATAEILLREGWTVVGVSRRPADFGSPTYRHVQADLADLEGLGATLDREIAPLLNARAWTRIGLVNNAALAGELRTIEEMNSADAAKAYAVNVLAPLVLMGFVARHAPADAALRVVNVSTGAAVHPLPGGSDYGGSKAALRLVSMTFAAELGSPKRPGGARRDFSVLSYAPGVVDTAMQASLRSQASPWSEMFADFHKKGMLVPADGPAQEMADFLGGDAPAPFLERRFGVR